MKTLEMFVELATYPERKYVSDDNIIASIDNEKNCVCFIGKNINIFVSNDGIYIGKERNWKPYKEPVSWQEAIQTWRDGKNFYIEIDNKTYKQYNKNNLGFLINEAGNQYGFFVRMFTEGQWYIEN